MSNLNHVSFEILLKAHGGDHGKAQKAWNAICHLGGYGNIPTNYTGGLDVKGLYIAQEEFDNPRSRKIGLDGLPMPLPPPPTSDDMKRLEDLAAGDKPTKKNTKKEK